MSVSEFAPRILVIEDDAALAELFTQVLADEGYASEVWSWPAAPDIAAAVGPDLILMDLLYGPLREPLGLACLRALKADPRTHAIPIVICTGSELARREPHAAELAGYGCAVIRKPFDLDELIAAVARCLAERETAPAA